MSRVFVFVTALSFALFGSALAAPAAPKEKPKDDRPAGTVGSGVMTMGQMQSGLQYLVAQKYGVSVNYVLPQGWEVVEQLRPGKGKSPGVFSTVSRRKMPDPNDPTDFIYELDIYEPNIMADIPAGLDQKKQDEEIGKRFRNFLDAQLSVNLKGLNKVVSKASDIAPKQYGPEGSRPKTTFVPIHYDVPPPKGVKGEGARLYTFTGLTGGHIWQVKFLVNKDQLDVYDDLIAVMVNNTFALTNKQQAELERNTEAVKARAKAAGKNQKSKGK